jgi:predicted ATP-binding protein involved in virulence
MINSIRIKNLFGRFEYLISMNASGITIITGPNGFGKSTILRIINALSKGNIQYFLKLDFSSLVVDFDNQEKISIQKKGRKIIIDSVQLPFFNEEQQEYIRFQRRPWIQRVPDGFIDRRTDEFFTEDEYFCHMYFTDDDRYLERYGNKKEHQAMLEIKRKFDQIKEWCGEVRFISDQRLIRTSLKRSDEPQVIDVIRELPQRLKIQISKVSEEYSRVANTLDSSYPKRLFAAKEGIKDQAEYKELLDEANKKFEKLSIYNLVDMSIIDEKNYNPIYSTALKIYFDDFTEKYKVFQNLISKLDLFTKIINNRLSFKRIRITRDNGFEVVDNDNPKKILQLSQLSSGEKQEIVLFYDLIFDTKEKLLLLIDEPEISLHITWQKKFLDDLLEVSKQIELQAIVATHSPQVVSNHLDIQIDLGELYGEKLNT